MKRVLIIALVVAGCALFNLAWDYLPLFSAVLTFGAVVGLPALALFAVVRKAEK
jgi:CHASE2 domain-containing sensor protein